MAIQNQGWAYVSGSTIGTATPGGLDTNIQFNNNGALSGSSALVTDGSGSLSASLNISASSFYGDGSNLTGLTASAVNVANGPEQAIQFRVDTPVSGEISGSSALMYMTSSNTLSGAYAQFTAVTASTIVGGSPLVLSASSTTFTGSVIFSGNVEMCNATASVAHLSGCSPIQVHAPMSSSYNISASAFYANGVLLGAGTTAVTSSTANVQYELAFTEYLGADVNLGGNAGLSYNPTGRELFLSGTNSGMQSFDIVFGNAGSKQGQLLVEEDDGYLFVMKTPGGIDLSGSEGVTAIIGAGTNLTVASAYTNTGLALTNMSGDAAIDIGHDGAISGSGNLTVGGTSTFNSTATFNNNASVHNQGLTVNNAAATINSNLVANGNITLGNASGDGITLNAGAITQTANQLTWKVISGSAATGSGPSQNGAILFFSSGSEGTRDLLKFHTSGAAPGSVFPQSVYLTQAGSLSGTLAGVGSYLGLDSNNKIVITSSAGGGAVSAVANGADNRVATFSSADALNGEANLTFDGTDLGVSDKIFHVGDTDTFIHFTTDDLNFQAGGVNFFDLTSGSAGGLPNHEVTFNEGGVDVDFRVETADESHMLFVEGSTNRVSIGDNTGSPGATLEVKNNNSAGATGVPLVQLNSNDTDEVALDINASNVDANVVAIAANSVTTAKVIQVSADGLTTGNALYVDDNSSDTGTRNTALIIQNNAAAINAKAFSVQSDGGKIGVNIDKNYSDTTEASVVGLNIDWDKTGTSTSDNTMYGIQIDMDNSTATNGLNTMYGIHVTPTLTHAANAGTPVVYGAFINAQGGTNGTSLVQGARIEAGGGDINYGIQLDVEDGGVDLRIESSADSGDYFQIQTTTAGATTITTVDDDGAAADLTFNVDGNITLNPVGGTVAITGSTATSASSDQGVYFRAEGPDPTTGRLLDQPQLVVSGSMVGIGTATPSNSPSVDTFLDVRGHMRVGRSGTGYIFSNNDDNTYIKFGGSGVPGGDGVSIFAGSKRMLIVDENDTTADAVIVGSASLETDFAVLTAMSAPNGDSMSTAPAFYVSGGADSVGVGTSSPLVSMDVHYTGSGNPVKLSNDTGGGEVVYFGTSSANLTPGGVYYLNANGGWESVNSATTGSGHNQLLGVALGTKAAGSGMLLKGYFDVTSFYSGSFIKGAPVYIQSSSVLAGRGAVEGGYLSSSAPTASNSYVRVVGYGTDTANVIYFNPDSTYIELS